MFQLLAVCPMGLESIVAKEIQELGYETQVENGRIFLKVTKMPSSNVTYGYVPQTVSKSSWDNLKQLRSMNYLKNKSITLGVNHRPTRELSSPRSQC